MTIPAVRFESFTKDFNIASTSFKSLKEDVILNSPETATIKETIASAKELITQLKDIKDSVEGEVKDLIKEATRITENFYNTFVDLTQLSEDFISSKIDELFPEDLGNVKNAIKNMTKTCRNQALGNALGFGKPKAAGCKNNISTDNCPPSSAQNVLGKALSSNLGSLVNNIQNTVAKIMALSNIGFSANLCGVFAAVTDSITDLSAIGLSAVTLANQQGSKGNLSAVFDISKTVAARDINVSGIIPNTVNNIVSGVKTLGSVAQNQVFDVWDSLEGSLETFDNNWLKSSDMKDSIEKLNSSSDIVKNLAKNKLRLNDFDTGDLNSLNNSIKPLIAFAAF